MSDVPLTIDNPNTYRISHFAGIFTWEGHAEGETRFDMRYHEKFAV